MPLNGMKRMSPARPWKRPALIASASAAALLCAVLNLVPAGGRAGTVPAGDGPMRLTAGSAVLMDAGSGRLLFEKNADDRVYPASTTKVLTALLALEECRLNDKVVVGNEIYRARWDSSKAGLAVGQVMTVRELLLGLLLPSGNDAAQSLAVHAARCRAGNRALPVGRAISLFVDMMNERARRLGAYGSHFVNPDGYHHPGHYSTARDMALIAGEAMKDPFFREAVARERFIPRAFGGDGNGRPKNGGKYGPAGGRVRKAGKKRRAAQAGPVEWENRNKLIDRRSPYYFPGATGIKTGHTAEAGYCLVASASADGLDLISVVMKDTEEGVWTDSARLLAAGFERAGARPSSGPGKAARDRR